LRRFCREQKREEFPAVGSYSRVMGDVVPLPVRREPPQEESGQPRREAPSRPRHDNEPRLRPSVEPLWRESVGHQLREERLGSGKRLVDVAEEAGVSPQYLSEVERGLKDPSSELLAAMAGALGLSIADLASRVASAEMSSHVPLCMAA
jgi:DNA-binding XRE family transcriptional regulator